MKVLGVSGQYDGRRHEFLGVIFGPEARVDTVGINTFEEQAASHKAAVELGKKIAKALKA